MANLILKYFRELMVQKNINVYVLPRTDEYQVKLYLLRISICLLLIKE